ncbi:hypothetical protein [Bifidobacterium porcinum]|uniref:hypothetical protein n=1 Tax=Bifidobacterium porcinum TaxID=212365 RepID=UPI0039925494
MPGKTQHYPSHHNIDNHTVGASSGRVLIENLDSVMQRKLWDDTLDGRVNTSNPAMFWNKTPSPEGCTAIVHNNPKLVERFAGILRTSFLYCPQILLTDAELFDGIFFLALGPQAINEILGKSLADPPSLIFSGRGNTFEHCLRLFTLRRINEIKPECKDTRYTVRPLKLSSMDLTITDDDAVSLNDSFYNELTSRVDAARQGACSIINVVIWAYEQYWSLQGHTALNDVPVQSNDNFGFLAQRWKEWSDAIAAGRVGYENQENPDFYRPILGKHPSMDNVQPKEAWSQDFKTIFRGIAKSSVPIINSIITRAGKNSAVSDRAENYQQAVKDIIGDNDKKKPIIERTKAFNRIDEACNEQDICTNNLRNILRDWYQFMYQRTLAFHLDATLIAVNAPENSYEQIAARSAIAQSDHQTHGGCHPVKSTTASTKKTHRVGALVLDEHVTKVLEKMSASAFGLFCYQTRTVIRKWRKCDASSIHKLKARTKDMAYSVYEADKEQDRRQEGLTIWKSFIFAAVLSIIAAMCDNVWFGNFQSNQIWIVVLVSWFVSMIPNFIEIINWERGVRRGVKTVIYMDRPDFETTPSSEKEGR